MALLINNIKIPDDLAATDIALEEWQVWKIDLASVNVTMSKQLWGVFPSVTINFVQETGIILINQRALSKMRGQEYIDQVLKKKS